MAVLAVFGQTGSCFSELLLIFYSYIVEVIFINDKFFHSTCKNYQPLFFNNIFYSPHLPKVEAVSYSCTFTVLAFEKKIATDKSPVNIKTLIFKREL